MDLNKPPKLKPGDTIAFIAPAGGLAALTPHRLKKGKKFFEEQGYEVKIYPTATKIDGHSSDTAENRAKDLMDAFKDEQVKAIISTIGGNTSHQILEYLDFEIIKKNPKILCGYSDITSLHLSLYSQTGLPGFYGPAVITQFGEHPKPDEYTSENFFKAVQGGLGLVEASKEWTDDKTGDWIAKTDLTTSRKYVKNEGFKWLNEGKAQGKIIGGCLPVILHLAGTKYWPDFTDSLLLLETPEGQDFRIGEGLSYVDSALGDLRNLGVYDQIKGIILGRGFGYTNEEHQQLEELIMYNTRGHNFPILHNLNIGHTDPIITIPIGVEVEIDSSENKFEFLEQGVKD